MSSPVGKLVVELVASVATFQTDLGKAAATAEQQARRIDRAIGDAKNQVLAFGKAIIGLGAGGFGAEKVGELFSDIREKVSESERSINQLNAVLQATGNTAGLTIQQLNSIGKGVEHSSIFDVDQIRAAETALLRFRTVQKDVFGQAIALTPDLATALGVDLPSAAEILGKALTNPATGMRALRTAGLALTEQQTDLAARMNETGDKAGAQQIVIDALTRSIGGAAEADTKGLYGASKRLTRSFGELEKAAGQKIFGDNHTAVEELIGFLDKLIDRVQVTKVSLADLATKPFAFANLSGEIAKFTAQSALGIQPQEGNRFASGKIGGIPSFNTEEYLVDLKAQAQKETEANDAAYSAQKVALQKRAENAATYFAQSLAQQKAFIQTQLADLEFGYSRGTVTVEQFFDKQKKLAQDEYAAITANLTKQGDVQAQLLNSTGVDPAQREAARARLQGIVDKDSEARLARNQKLHNLDLQEVTALEKQADEYTLIAAKLDEINGNSADAVKAQQEVAERFRRAQLTQIVATGDPVSAALAASELKTRDAIDQHAQAQAKLNDLQEVYGRDLERLGIAQAQVDIAQQTGSISELSALSQKSALAANYIVILKGEIEQHRAIAELSGDPKLILQVQKEELALQQLAASTDLVRQKFDGIITDNVATFLDDLIDHTKTVRQSFDDMAKGIERSITHLITEDLSKQLYKSLIDDSGSGPGDILGKLLGLFGGPADAGAPGASVYDFGGAADGTNFAPGGPMWVGERGPELLNLPRGSKVIPNHELRYQSGSGNVYNSSTTINLPAPTSRASVAQLASKSATESRRSLARLGR